jgi:hypothetical protein
MASFEVNFLCFVPFHAQQLKEFGHRDLFEIYRFNRGLAKEVWLGFRK